MKEPTRQRGIERVLQDKGGKRTYEGGKMNAAPETSANWRRSSKKMTPRGA